MDTQLVSQFSPYQETIFDWIRTGEGDAVVEAVAGSGKTTTLIEASKRIEYGPVLFCAFNKEIVKELSSRLGSSAQCQTINSIGHRALMRALSNRLKLDAHKYRNIAYDMTQELQFEERDRRDDVRDAINKLVSFVQTTYSEIPTDIMLNDLVEHYGIELPNGKYTYDWYFNKVHDILKIGIQVAERDLEISFNDQIWLPNLWNVTPPQFPFVMVDEAQDLSKGKLELILRTRAAGGRMLFVGDSRQSIYGFAGADPAAWQTIIERTNATVLPLSICYRCPTSHLDIARELVPHIEARPDAPVGVVETISENDFVEKLQTNDLVMCRTTAPLLKWCIKCIKNQVPARVLGRDISRSLIALGKDAAKLGPIDAFNECLQAAVDKKIATLRGRKNTESQIAALEDRQQGLWACFDGLQPYSYEEFWRKIDEMFSDSESVITFATVHRVKGLQRKRTFILYPGLLGVFGRQEWEREQEQNLKYVALTRATDEMYFVGNKPAKVVQA